MFDLRPASIISALDLRRPLYAQTAPYCHFGAPGARVHVGADPARHRDASESGVVTMSRQLITSALPNINWVKHLGNLIGSMLPADVYARFPRHTGDEVLFFCATDEHGTPA